jgi:hypothetical protein
MLLRKNGANFAVAFLWLRFLTTLLKMSCHGSHLCINFSFFLMYKSFDTNILVFYYDGNCKRSVYKNKLFHLQIRLSFFVYHAQFHKYFFNISDIMPINNMLIAGVQVKVHITFSILSFNFFNLVHVYRWNSTCLTEILWISFGMYGWRSIHRTIGSKTNTNLSIKACFALFSFLSWYINKKTGQSFYILSFNILF